MRLQDYVALLLFGIGIFFAISRRRIDAFYRRQIPIPEHFDWVGVNLIIAVFAFVGGLMLLLRR